LAKVVAVRTWIFLLVIGVVVAVRGADTPARPKAISGTFTAAFEGFSEFGQPKVRLRLQLASTLTCPPSAPKLTFGVNGGAAFHFVSAPGEEAGYTSAGFTAGVEKDGTSEVVTTALPTGSLLVGKARSATCQCGHRYGEGGYIDLETPPLAIPPWVALALAAKAGTENYLNITATPRGAESVEVHVVGAGLDLKRSFTRADYGNRSAVTWPVTPAAAGDLVVTATLQPAGATYEAKFAVAAH
jgi:hypothetical protein